MSPAALARKLLPLGRSNPVGGSLFRTYAAGAGDGVKRKRSLARRMVPIGVISLAGGIALSAINDLAIFHGCTSKAIEKATENREVVEAIGVPIVRGPWYDASVAVGHRRRSVLCTFPVYGPQGSGQFHIEAIRSGEDGVLSFLRHHDWEILVMDACLEVPLDGDRRKTVAINLTNSTTDHASVGAAQVGDVKK